MKTESSKASTLKRARTYRAPRQLTDVTIFQFLHSLDTPRSLTVWLLFKNKEHDQLVDLKIDPNSYNSSWRFRDDYVATEFLSKANFLELSVDRKTAAMAKFEEFESRCSHTNRRFRNPILDPQNNGSNVWLLNATKRKIDMILGDFSGDELIDDANWGPGVSTLLKGEEVSGYNKFTAERGITRDLYSLISPWFSTAYPLWADHLSREFGESWAVLENGNTIVTVPKNSKTDRVIAVEPGINLWFQKGCGSMIRRRLRRFGVDLNSQQRNADLARRASYDNSLATVDFSSASDSIARAVVEELLPRRWFVLLDSLRSKFGVEQGSCRIWNKFSSMGNGFTFELESLIFYAAALAVAEYEGVSTTDISVFGDDVILPTSCFALFSEFSEFLGFHVNPKKSFSSSAFRESCGAHWYNDVDCKPVYLKERLSNVETVYRMANAIRLHAHRRGHYDFCDRMFLDAWLTLYRGLPESLRLAVPATAGDVGFISNFDEARPARARRGFEGYLYPSLASIGVTRSGDGQGLTLAQLRRLGNPELLPDFGSTLQNSLRLLKNIPTRERFWVLRPDLIASGESYTLRGRVRRTLCLSLVPQWYDMGPWL